MTKLVEEFPPIKDARIISAPIVSVLILEDRAQIKRRVSIALEPSPSLRLAIKDVAPVLRDVSVLARSESEGLRIVDVRAERALRVKRSERSKEAVALEDQARALLKRFERLERERARTETNVERLLGAWAMPHTGAKCSKTFSLAGARFCKKTLSTLTKS